MSDPADAVELQRRCDLLDAQAGPLDAWRAAFAAGDGDTLYFDANSIGPMPLGAPQRMNTLLDQGWRIARRRGWNQSWDEGDWLEQPRLLGARLARVLGAEPDDVLVCDSTSVNHYKLLCHALAITRRRVIVVERDVFPTNRYVAQGVAAQMQARVRLLDRIEDLPQALAPGDVAVVSLSHVDYRDSRRLDMAALSAVARQHGALALWDLSHSAGAIDVALRRNGADMAVASGYKYLCGGPGAPAVMYLHPRHRDAAWPALAGWMGHADTFAFDGAYEPAPGIARFLVGTPAVLANTAFSTAAEIWQHVDPRQMDERHRALTDMLIALIDARCAGLGLELSSPREHARRGGHVALRFDGAQPLAQALVEAGVVVSARKPDALRLGVHPLTTRFADLVRAVDAMQRILASGSWRDPRFAQAQV